MVGSRMSNETLPLEVLAKRVRAAVSGGFTAEMVNRIPMHPDHGHIPLVSIVDVASLDLPGFCSALHAFYFWSVRRGHCTPGRRTSCPRGYHGPSGKMIYYYPGEEG